MNRATSSVDEHRQERRRVREPQLAERHHRPGQHRQRLPPVRSRRRRRPARRRSPRARPCTVCASRKGIFSIRVPPPIAPDEAVDVTGTVVDGGRRTESSNGDRSSSNTGVDVAGSSNSGRRLRRDVAPGDVVVVADVPQTMLSLVAAVPQTMLSLAHAVPQTMLSQSSAASSRCPTRCCRSLAAASCPTRCCLRRRHRAPDDVVVRSAYVPHTMLSSLAEAVPHTMLSSRGSGAPHDVVAASRSRVPQTMFCPVRLLAAPQTMPAFQAGAFGLMTPLLEPVVAPEIVRLHRYWRIRR